MVRKLGDLCKWCPIWVFFTVFTQSDKGFKKQIVKLNCVESDKENCGFFYPENSPRFQLQWHRPRNFNCKAEHYLTNKDEKHIQSKGLLRSISSRPLLNIPFVENPTALFLGSYQQFDYAFFSLNNYFSNYVVFACNDQGKILRTQIYIEFDNF